MTDHCAKFSDALLPRARHLLSCVAGLPTDSWIVDPYAGTGKGPEYLTEVCGFCGVGIELEPEWAAMSDLVHEGDALMIPSPAELYDRDDPKRWDAVFTSPPFGNRMADVDMRDSVAGTYAKSLGRRSSPGSANHLQWGPHYREHMLLSFNEMRRVLRSDGWALINIKDHPRDKQLQGVPGWYIEAMEPFGFYLVDKEFVETPGNRRGANTELRVDGEWLFLFQLKGGK